jgi:HSP20 family protein
MPWNPRNWDMPVSLSKLQDEMNNMFDRLWHKGVTTGPFDGQGWAPAMDLYECANDYTLFVEVPGVDPNSIELSVLSGALTVRGSKAPREEEHPGQQRIRSERRFGSFCRTVDLPAEINADAIDAKCAGGVLRVTIPKVEASRPKAIKVNVAGAP